MDFDLLTPRFEEGSEIEPKYFLPIIPTVLLNGGSGIAVGFATNILNRNPLDLVEACLKTVDSKPFADLTPWYYGFSGSCSRDVDSSTSWIFRGKYEVKNTSTVEVTELPPSMTYEKYESYLNQLEESRKIVGYENHCTSNIRYVIKFRREDLKKLQDTDKLDRFLKNEERQSENLTVLDENGDLKIFTDPTQIVKYFVDFRLKYYVKRKSHLINKISNELMVLSNRANFIKSIIDGRLKVNNVPKKDIILHLESANFDQVDGSYSYLLNMQIHTLTKEKYEELLLDLSKKESELEEIKRKEPSQMYKDDLNQVKKVLLKSYSK